MAFCHACHSPPGYAKTGSRIVWDVFPRLCRDGSKRHQRRELRAITHVGIALTFGLVVLALIYALGDVPGAHFDPAVTIGFWIAGRFPGRSVAGYVLSQCGGALSASLLLRGLFPTHVTLGARQPAGRALLSFVLETILTWFLMLVILSVSTCAKEKGITAGIAVGAVIALEALFAGPITAASMNPARFLAPALVSAPRRVACRPFLPLRARGRLLSAHSQTNTAKLNQGVNHRGSAGNAREPAGGERMAARGLNRTSSHARLRL